MEADFSYVYEDVDAYVQYAKGMGFKHIILGGHSLGSNKIIHYLRKTTETCIEYYIISAPVDMQHWWNVIKEKDTYLAMARKAVAEERADEVMLYIFNGFSPMRARTVVGLYENQSIRNTPLITGEGETDSLAAITIHGAYIIGSKDNVAGPNPKEFMEKISACTPAAADNKVVEIMGASHIFYGMHDEYAAATLDCIQNHHGLKV